MKNVFKCKLHIILFIFVVFSIFLLLPFPASAEDVSILEIGTVVNAKMKSLAANAEKDYEEENRVDYHDRHDPVSHAVFAFISCKQGAGQSEDHFSQGEKSNA